MMGIPYQEMGHSNEGEDAPLAASDYRLLDLSQPDDDEEIVTSVKVVARVRPNTNLKGNDDVAYVDLGSKSIVVRSQQPQRSCSPTTASGCFPLAGADNNGPNQGKFQFDEVFGPSASQETIYKQSVAPLVQKFLKGYNATLMAYGQTSSGKTYTMGTNNNSEAGMIPQAVASIFEKVDPASSISISFIEIYNEGLIDLLHSSDLTSTNLLMNPAKITIRQDTKGRIHCLNASKIKVSHPEQVQRLLKAGNLRRSTSSTLMNENSSRSHAVFTLFLNDTKLQSKLHFVDLAGSERIKKTGAVGDRVKEGISINSGLLALSNVIGGLAESKSANHIPYRESKLTRLLQDSIGGNALTTMIACISSSSSNMSETINTLKYALRARRIKSSAKINKAEASLPEIIRSLKDEIQKLKTEGRVSSQVSIRMIKEPPKFLTDLLNRHQRVNTELLNMKRKYHDLLRDHNNLKASTGDKISKLVKERDELLESVKNQEKVRRRAETVNEKIRDPLSILEFASNWSQRSSNPYSSRNSRTTSSRTLQLNSDAPCTVAKEKTSPALPNLRISHLAPSTDETKEPIQRALEEITKLNQLVDHLNTVTSLYTNTLTSPTTTKSDPINLPCPSTTNTSSIASQLEGSSLPPSPTPQTRNYDSISSISLETATVASSKQYRPPSITITNPFNHGLRAPVPSPTTDCLTEDQLKALPYMGRELNYQMMRQSSIKSRRRFKELICI